MKNKGTFLLSTYPLGLWHGCSLMHEVMGSTCIRPNGVLGSGMDARHRLEDGESDHDVHRRSSESAAVQLGAAFRRYERFNI